MTNACEFDTPEHEYDSLSSPAIESLDAKHRRIAKKLHDAAYVYALYGALDGLSLSYSMVKYGFDLLYTNSSLSSSDVMHDWMMTPGGLAAAGIETVSIIAFSMLGNLLKENDKNAFNRYIAILWPYFRDSTKGLKNAYKGVRGALQAISFLGGEDLRYMMVPVGLVLGVISVGNRIWYRQMKDTRKASQAVNSELLLEIQAASSLYLMTSLPQNTTNYKNRYILVNQLLYYIKPDGNIETVIIDDMERFLVDLKEINTKNSQVLYLSEHQRKELITSNGGHIATDAFDDAACTAYRERIKRQSTSVRRSALLSAWYGGVVDGLYLFMGSLGITALAPPVFMTMIVFSAVFTLTCIVTRMWEESEYQRRLVSTEATVELALCGKELEGLFAKLHRDYDRLITPPSDSLETDQQQTMKLIELKMKEFETKQSYLSSQITLSHTSAALSGLRDGLAAYNAISSMMFAVAVVTAMLAAPFPPAFLIACAVAGMACLLGFLAHSLVVNHAHLRAHHPQENTPSMQLHDLLRAIKDKSKKVSDLKPTEVKEAILDGMVVDPSPQFFFQEWFEVVRSLFSGLSKGQKSVDYTLYPLQEVDEKGHYHDTTIMLWITAITSTIYAVGLALRAYARGFNQSPSHGVKTKTIPKITDKASPRDEVTPAQLPTQSLSPEEPDDKPTELLAPPPPLTRGAGSGLGPVGHLGDPTIPDPERPSSSWFQFFPSTQNRTTTHSFNRPASAENLTSYTAKKPLAPSASGIDLRV